MQSTELTLADLFAYVQTAERDSFGYHYLSDMYGPYRMSLHIYSGLRQINFCIQNHAEPAAWPISIGNMIFSSEDDMVLIYPVVNGIADYANIDVIPFNTLISELSNIWKTSFRLFSDIAFVGNMIGIIATNLLQVRRWRHDNDGGVL